MGKWKSSYDSGRRFQSEWMKELVWAKEAPDGSGSAYCKLCNCNIVPKKHALDQHAETVKHKTRTPNPKLAPRLSTSKAMQTENDEVKKAELEMAVAVCCHCSISSIDHVGELMKKHGKGSVLGKTRMHRTKCQKLMTQVISPAMRQELKKAVAGKKFSVIVDESTDVACGKQMAVMVRFFHDKEKRIVTEFLDLIPVCETDAESLFSAIKGALEEAGLSLKDCVGYGTDGAAVMVGCNNSVWTRLQEENPDCIQMRCVCHSLALCVQTAFHALPASIGFILAEVPKWFSKSTLRRESFNALFNTMDPNGERKGTPSPFQKASATRWLVRGKVLANILANWEELKAYFLCAERAANMANKFKCRILREMLMDPTTYWYLQCVTPVIQDFEKVNAHFQSTDGDPHELENILLQHYNSLKMRLYDGLGRRREAKDVDLGARFMQETNQHLQKHPEDEEKVKDVRSRSEKFLQVALEEVEKRLPPVKGVFKALSFLSPAKVLNQMERPPFASLPCPKLREDNLDRLEQQYRQILHVDWREELGGAIPVDSVEFWAAVADYKAMKSHPFQELAAYALACLSTPVSNAVVERVFSQVTLVKTKARNRMGSGTLSAIIRIRAHLYFRNMCCQQFVPTDDMLQLFNTVNMYDQGAQTDAERASDLWLF